MAVERHGHGSGCGPLSNAFHTREDEGVGKRTVAQECLQKPDGELLPYDRVKARHNQSYFRQQDRR